MPPVHMITTRTLTLIGALALSTFSALAQRETNSTLGSYAVTALNTTYSQDFNTLASANNGQGTDLPIGWTLVEYGNNANTAYTAGTGSANSGDSYSFGAASSTERAFGGLRSSNLVPSIGFKAVNGSASTITNIRVKFTAELWRRGATNRRDSLRFFYRLGGATAPNVAAIDTLGTEVPALVYASPTGTSVANGSSAPLHTQTLEAFINLPGAGLAPGNSITLAWIDEDVVGSEDGIGVDDLEIEFRDNTVSAQPRLGNSLRIYPNPSADGRLLIEGLTAPTTVEVLNLAGQTLARSEAQPGLPVDFGQLPRGTYLVRIGQQLQPVKWVKQ